MAQRNLRAAADESQPSSAARRRARRRSDEESAGWRDAAQAMLIPYDETLGIHPQAEGFTEHAPWDFERDCARAVPAAAALPLLRSVSQAGRQTGRSRACAVSARRRLHPGAEGPQLRVLRAANRPRLFTVRHALRQSSRPRSGTSSWPTTTSARPPCWTWTTSSTTRAMVCTSPRWPGRGSPRSLDSAGCATTTARSASPRACPTRLTRLTFRLCFRGRRLLVDGSTQARDVFAAAGRAARDLPLRRAGHGRGKGAADPPNTPGSRPRDSETTARAGADPARIRRAPGRHRTKGGIVNAATVSERGRR